MTRARFGLWLLATLGGLVIGFGMAFVAASVTLVVLPHCGIPCDDSGPEFVAAAAAYGTWLLTALVTSVLAWRHLAAR